MAGTRLRVAVLGGGMQGVCTALELAERGAEVELIDRGSDLMTGAASANEGKIHLGYIYAADRSLNTARRMMEGAAVFAPYVRRWVGTAFDDVPRSDGFVYAVHRDSQVPAEEFYGYLHRCADLFGETAASPDADYFGISSGRATAPQPLSASELGSLYNPDLIHAAFRTVELAVDSLALARLLKERVRAEPRIHIRLNRTVVGLRNEQKGPVVVSDGPKGPESTRYDHVVNALWDGRFAAEATLGAPPSRPWIHRYKYGIRVGCPAAAADLPTMVVVHGPFGDIVRYSDGGWYLSWYPACHIGTSTDLSPPDWWRDSDPARSASIIEDTMSAFADIMPALRNLTPGQLQQPALIGGTITAWGKTDIYDPASELHNRYEIGVHSTDRYHSIDTGKYTMAPRFARICADRIYGR